MSEQEAPKTKFGKAEVYRPDPERVREAFRQFNIAADKDRPMPIFAENDKPQFRPQNGTAEQRVTNPEWLRKGIDELKQAIEMDAETGRNNPPPVLDVDFIIGESRL